MIGMHFLNITRWIFLRTNHMIFIKKIREPIANFVSGNRFGSILDPFGVRWTIMTRIEDLSEEESHDRVRA